ncbi:MAG: hypothetical protein CMH64_04315 [Nanoarchaeota archaeon]|nr:hypothetical protein [Nanoarchaeota archaeon]|tara:strand:- start:2072 stop:2830 length:759 start_codon:yes stop_codon:yes gene_type:complete
MKEELLREIGLTQSEIKVYLSLLELGDSTRGDIVNESRIAGSKIYEILEKLQEKGFVSIYTKNKVKHFKPTNPQQIIYYLEEKKSQIEEVEKQTQQLLPSLLEKFSSSKEEEEVEVLSGIKGLEVLFREQVETLKRGETCYVIGGTRGYDEENVEAFFHKIQKMRQKKGIKTRMVFNIKQRESYAEQFSSKVYKFTEIRYMHHTSPVAINFYKDKTIIIIFGKKTTSIYINSKEVANSFMEYFNLLWKTTKK